MRPDAVTLLFKEAFDVFPPIEGNPTDDDLLSIREVLLPILRWWDPYPDSLLTDAAKYASAHGGTPFIRPARLPLYDGAIPDYAASIVRVKTEAAHKLKLKDFANYEAAERGCSKFLRDVVDEVWNNDLKDADTFYTQVMAQDIIPSSIVTAGASTQWT
jgi:hypothetical protein